MLKYNNGHRTICLVPFQPLKFVAMKLLLSCFSNDKAICHAEALQKVWRLMRWETDAEDLTSTDVERPVFIGGRWQSKVYTLVN